MTTFKISVNAPEQLRSELLNRAEAAGVPLGTYCLAVLSTHVAKHKPVQAEPPKIGLAAVDKETRREITQAGGLAVTGKKAHERAKRAQKTRKENKLKMDRTK